MEIRGFYRTCDFTIEGVDQSIVNLVYSFPWADSKKNEFFTTPIYELHGFTPIELSQMEEGSIYLRNYMYYLDAYNGDGMGI